MPLPLAGIGAFAVLSQMGSASAAAAITAAGSGSSTTIAGGAAVAATLLGGSSVAYIAQLPIEDQNSKKTFTSNPMASEKFEAKQTAPLPRQRPETSPPIGAIAAHVTESNTTAASAIIAPTVSIGEGNADIEPANQNNSTLSVPSSEMPYRLEIEETALAPFEVPQTGVGSVTQTVVSETASNTAAGSEMLVAKLNNRIKTSEEPHGILQNKNTRLRNTNANTKLRNQNKQLENEVKQLKSLNAQLRIEVKQSGEIIAELRQTNQQQQLINQNLLAQLNAFSERLHALEQGHSSSQVTSQSNRHQENGSDTALLQAGTQSTSLTNSIDRVPMNPTLPLHQDFDPSQSLSLPLPQPPVENALVMPTLDEHGSSSTEGDSDMSASGYTDSSESSYVAANVHALA